MKQGFSLIELLLVISMISILSAFSISGAQQLFHTRAHDNALLTLKNTLHSAQSNSQSTGFTTIVCPSSDAETCDNNADWSNGWITYKDTDDSHTLSDDESLILVRQIENQQLDIQFNALGNGAKMIFYPTGRLWPNGNFIICHEKVINKYKITTTLSGRIRSDEDNSFVCE